MIKIKNIYTLVKLIKTDLLNSKNCKLDHDNAIEEAIQWLCRAQDSTNDGGVSEGYHLIYGWLPSYPETTGYIIETFFDYYKQTKEMSYMDRALKMADWLIGIQHKDGAITDSYFKKKLVFDTGQVLFGLVKAHEETGNIKYKNAAILAGKWLTSVQENDGAWRKYAIGGIPHTYYTRVAWSLLKLYHISKEPQLLESCKKNIEWAISKQQKNGWFKQASFTEEKHSHPFTHTIAYTIRGILESGIYLKHDKYINAAKTAMDYLLKVLPESGDLSGSYNSKWEGAKEFSCLTGNAQFAIIYFKLFQLYGKEQYLIAGSNLNNYLLTKQITRYKNRNIFGAIAGSFPIWGNYIHFMFPNWATKFLVDALMEQKKSDL